MEILLLVILVLALVGALPVHSYSRNWGYYPSAGTLVLVIILLVFFNQI